MNLIIFDFDGLLVDSVRVKQDCFTKISENYGYRYSDVVASISVQKKVWTRNDFFREISKMSNMKIDFESIKKEFDIMCFDAIICADREDNLQFYRDKSDDYWALVSATPEVELKKIVGHFQWSKYFQSGIYGAPSSKVENIIPILKKFKNESNQCYMLGDTVTDFDVSKKLSLDFAWISRWSHESDAQFPRSKSYGTLGEFFDEKCCSF